ncbi:hypothetical protein FACS1894122_14720 [Alphaproteobacteria bacterium]|nr:hypothetical protein FACS1894122_14720 [Alphaproteobacteria bacterium]
MKKIIAALGLIGTIALPSADAMMEENTSAKDDVYAPVVVESQYEVANGFNGMLRDVIIRLMGIICDNEKVRQILGMNYEIYAFKNHAYFQDFYQKPMLLNRELYHAAGWEDSDAVAALIKQGAKVNSRTDSSTPLHYAAECAVIDNVKVLLANKADPNAKNVAPRGNGRTPLHEAARCARSSSIEIMKILLAVPGIRVDELDGNCNTALHIAAWFDLNKIRVDELDGNGATARHIAAWFNQAEAIETLLDVGHANIDARNAEGKTPLDLVEDMHARFIRDYDIVDYHLMELYVTSKHYTLDLLRDRHAKHGYEVK